MSQVEVKEETWTVPREWAGERCFIIAGGESVRAQEKHIPRIKGRIIAIKQAVALRPDADVMFVAGRDDPVTCAAFYPMFRGRYIVSRKRYPGFPDAVRCMRRTKLADRLSHDPGVLAGLDAGTSAINLAYLFGAVEVVLLGYDMRGGRWLNDRMKHHLPFPPQEHFRRHMAAVEPLSRDLVAAGVRVVNVSPVSAVRCFERGRIEDFL